LGTPRTADKPTTTALTGVSQRGVDDLDEPLIRNW
jgi:hypothetical protein